MVGTEWIEAEVLKAVPDAIVEVIDLHRSGDHFHVRIISLLRLTECAPFNVKSKFLQS